MTKLTTTVANGQIRKNVHTFGGLERWQERKKKKMRKRDKRRGDKVSERERVCLREIERDRREGQRER